MFAPADLLGGFPWPHLGPGPPGLVLQGIWFSSCEACVGILELEGWSWAVLSSASIIGKVTVPLITIAQSAQILTV